MKKRIVLVDDHPIVRQGFVQLINQEPDLSVVGEAEDASGAMDLITGLRPELVLIDLTLRESNGLELTKELHRLYPKMLLLVVSLHDENVYAERALRAGAKGFIMKSEATENVMVAIRRVLSGEMYLSENMRHRILERVTGGMKKLDSPLEGLSDRELEVFQMIGRGIKTRLIAESLNLSVKTIETYKSHLKSKLNLTDSTELMQRAVEWTLKNEQS